MRGMGERITTVSAAAPAVMEVVPVDGPGTQPAISFEDLYREEHERLYRALCLVTRNRHEAEDLVQEAFLRVLERWERPGAIGDPVGYLYRTAMNAFRSGYRRAALALKRGIGVVPPDDELERLEGTDWVLATLAPLSRRQRAAVILVDLLGCSSEEAGRMLSLSASTVRVHVARAHAALRQRMEVDDEPVR